MPQFNEDKIERLLRVISRIQPTRAATERAVGRIREALREAETKKTSVSENIWGVIMRRPITKLAAAAVIVIAIIIVFSRLGGSGIAFAEVLRKVQGAGYTFDLRVIGREDSNTNKAFVFKPGRVRIDAGGQVQVSSIFDVHKGEGLLLFHQQKAGMVFKKGDLGPDLTSGAGLMGLFIRPVENLWNLKDGTEKEIGEKEIEGRRVKGFKVFQEDKFCKYEITIWADVKTSEPVLVEVVMKAKDNPKESMTFVMDNFKLDAELEESLFSLEVPAGYTLAYQKGLDELDTGKERTGESEKIERLLGMWEEGEKEKAIEILMGIDWSKQFAFLKKPYIFTVTENGYVSLKADIQQQVMKEVMKTGETIREITREVISRGQESFTGKDYSRAEGFFNASFQLGRLITSNPDYMLVSRLVGIAVKKKALIEMEKLYKATNNQGRLSEVQKEIQSVDAEYKRIREIAEGR